jgi:hypothetical protein
MSWIWMNIPAAAVIFAAIVGIPLWIVINYPDGVAGRRRSGAQPVTVPVSDHRPRPGHDRPRAVRAYPHPARSSGQM